MNEILDFLSARFSTVKTMQGDASTRCYFRVSDKAHRSAIVLKDSSVHIERFLAIRNILEKHNLRVPKFYEYLEDISAILIEDLGNKLLLNIGFDEALNVALPTLPKLHSIKSDLPPLYSKIIYEEEADRLNRFYLSAFDLEDKEFSALLAPHAEKWEANASNFIHLDFIAPNLFSLDSELGIIDFQDARLGLRVYDYASIIDDIRRDQPIEARNYWRIKLNDMIFTKEEIFDFEALSAQRLIKIIGIFARLTREGRDGYLEFIPRCYSLLLERTRHEELKIWHEWVRDVVPEPTENRLRALKERPIL